MFTFNDYIFRLCLFLVFTCPDYVSQTSYFDPSVEVRIPIVTGCNGIIGEECTYSCPKGWIPSNDGPKKVTCNPTGWGAKNLTWDKTFQLCVG